MRKLWLVSVCFSACVACGMAQSTPDQAKIQVIMENAEAGKVDAQLHLGVMYELGEDIPQNYGKAVWWYQKAAGQGDAKAQFNLGLMYAFGRGVAQSYAEAAKWYRMAAEQGDAQAQSNLGSLYYEGQGMPEDDKEAAKWFQKAAERGRAFAQANLGMMYERGDGMAQDYKEAYFWLEIAYTGNLQAFERPDRFKDIMEHRDNVAKHLSEADLRTVAVKASQWLESHQ